MENEIQMPIDRLSFSALRSYWKNQMDFKKKYILKIRDGLSSVPMCIGQACHKALEYRYTDMEQHIEDVIKVGMDYLVELSDGFIDYGKTWDREMMLKKYNQVIRFYLEAEPKYHKILFVEEKWEAQCKTINGDVLPIPFSGIADMVHQFTDNEEDVEIIDYKFSGTFSNFEEEDYPKIIQAMFMYHLLLETKGIKAKRMLFRQVKISKNSDGSPQIQDYSIPFDHTPYFELFYNLVNDVVHNLKIGARFIPNFDDMFTGKDSGLIYAQGLMAADMSDVEVLHKMKDVNYVQKKFIPSKVDSKINENLLPEEKIRLKLAEFGIPVLPVEKKTGAQVTQYRFKVAAGIKMQTVKKMKDDIELALESDGKVNILAPIQGTSLVGVEVPNKDRTKVYFDKKLLNKGTLKFPIGQTIDGEHFYGDIAEMPHLLIAGTTGSGKSVLLNVILESISAQNSAKELQLVLIDPKRVELAGFADLAHVEGNKTITDGYEASIKLQSIMNEVENRYELLRKSKTKDIEKYNAKAKTKLPRIVVVIDEYADFMLQPKVNKSKKKDDRPEPINAEISITRLAAMGRAAGVHIILATQRPSVDVVTGLIKANFPTRIALTTSSVTDSRIILDESGAEKLTGRGDLLFKTPSQQGLIRLQGYSIK